jgi:hypothetical protein
MDVTVFMTVSVSIYTVSDTQSVTWMALTVATLTEFTTLVATFVTIESSLMPSISVTEVVVVTAGVLVYSTISFQPINVPIYYTTMVSVAVYYAVAQGTQPSKGISNGVLIGTTTGAGLAIAGIVIAVITVVRSKYKASSSGEASPPELPTTTPVTRDSLSGSSEEEDKKLDTCPNYELEVQEELETGDGFMSKGDIYI